MPRVLPQNIEAEEAVLGSLIIDPEAIVEVADWLKPEDFYRNADATVYRAILALYEQKSPADYVTLCDELRRRDVFDDIGGEAFIFSLMAGVPTSVNIGYYAKIVERASLNRKLIHAAAQIAALAYNEDDARSALDKSQQLLFTLAEQGHTASSAALADMLAEFYEQLDSLHTQGGHLGLFTGFKDLDHKMGGLQKTDLVILAARPAVGKTSFALSVAYWTAQLAKARTLIFSLEMSKEQVLHRLLSMDSGVSTEKMRLGIFSDTDLQAISQSMGKLMSFDIVVDDGSEMTLMGLRTRARRVMAERPIDLIIVDYLQLMGSDEHHENRQQQVSGIARGLKNLARDLRVPVLALSQFSRAAEQAQGGIPLLSHLRESGEIEQAADICLLMYRPEHSAGTINIVIAKHRHGPIGEVGVQFEAQRTLFRNLAHF